VQKYPAVERGRPGTSRAFTLIEIIIAVAILTVILLMAVPSLEGVFADRKLRASLDGFNKLVREAQERRGSALTLTLPAALTAKPAGEWIFWPTGTCEPAIVRFVGRAGTWTANYSPLTGYGQLANYAAK